MNLNPAGMRTAMNINILPTAWQYDADMVDWVYVKVLDEMVDRKLIIEHAAYAMTLRADEVSVRFVGGVIACDVHTMEGCYHPTNDLVEVGYMQFGEQNPFKTDEQVYCILGHELLHFILTKMGGEERSVNHRFPYFGNKSVEEAVCRTILFPPK